MLTYKSNPKLSLYRFKATKMVVSEIASSLIMDITLVRCNHMEKKVFKEVNRFITLNAFLVTFSTENSRMIEVISKA